MHTYYHEGILTNKIVLNEEESHHAVKVMRSSVGTKVRIINGAGSLGWGTILDNHAKRCAVGLDRVEEESPPKHTVFIAIAPTKANDRIEFFLEKATEIGVSGIIPLLCKNNERDKVNLIRWQKVVLAAVKQSQRLWMPEILHPMKFSEIISDNKKDINLIAYCEDLPEKSIGEFAAQNGSKLVLIGPEGDFAQSEVLQATEAGFQKVNLGNNRLRTETAGIVAITRLML